jgi:hypothetical protein
MTKLNSFIYLFAIWCFSINSFCQSKLELISFKSLNTVKTPNVESSILLKNNGVEVSVTVSIKQVDAEKIKIKSILDTVFIIKSQSFDKLENAVLTLNSTSFLSNIRFKGMKGFETEVTFGNDYNAIIYRVWSPFVETKKRGLDPYINFCKQIVKIGKLDAKSVL